MNLAVTPIANSVIFQIFPKVVPLLNKGKKFWQDYYDLDDIQKLLIKGKLQLWVGIEQETNTIKIAMLTSIEMYPKSKWVRIIYIGGEGFKDALYYLKELEMWARGYDCRGFEVITRDGMERKLKPFKFTKKASWLVKKFEDG